MKRNFGGTFKNLAGASLVQRVPNPDLPTLDEQGNPILDSAGKPVFQETTVPCAVSDMVCTALLYDFPQEKLEAAEKHRRFKLAQRIYNAYNIIPAEATPGEDARTVDVSMEEGILLKGLMSQLYNSLIVGQFVDLIEG